MNKREVQLSGVDVGNLLQEVSRAYLHHGSPSAMLKRMSDGVTKYLNECVSEEDKSLAQSFLSELSEMERQFRTFEDSLYDNEKISLQTIPSPGPENVEQSSIPSVGFSSTSALMVKDIQIIEGLTYVIVDCHDEEYYNSLPRKVSYNGVICEKSAWNVSRNLACYQSNRE